LLSNSRGHERWLRRGREIEVRQAAYGADGSELDDARPVVSAEDAARAVTS